MAGSTSAEIADAVQIDLAQLRKLAAVRGLVNNEVSSSLEHDCLFG